MDPVTIGLVAAAGGAWLGGLLGKKQTEVSPYVAKIDALNYQLLRQQKQEYDAMLPLLRQAAGVKLVDGKYERMSEDELYATMSPSERLAYDNTMLQQERLNKALKGELEVPEYVRRQIGEGSARTEELLSRSLGDTWAASSAGVRKKAETDAAYGMILDQYRQGELSSGGQMLGLLSENLNTQTQRTLNVGSTLPFVSSGILSAGTGMSQDLYNRYVAQQQLKGNKGGLQGVISGATSGALLATAIPSLELSAGVGAAIGGGLGLLGV